MAFVTAQEIVDRVGNDAAVQLTTDSGSTVDTAMIGAMIAEVEPRVVGALRRRVAVTVTQADYPKTYDLVRGVIIDMVLFRLHVRRPPVNQAIIDLNKNAGDWLKMLAAGDIALPDVELNEPGADYGSAGQVASAADR